jgi:hypothetical protein
MIRTHTFNQNVITCCLSMIIKDKIIGTCRRAKLMMKFYRNFQLKVKIRHMLMSQANAERTSKFYKFMQKRASRWSLQICRRGIGTWLYNFSSYMAMNETIKYCPYLLCKYSFGFNQQLVSTHYYRMMIHKYITGYGGKTQVHA